MAAYITCAAGNQNIHDDTSDKKIIFFSKLIVTHFTLYFKCFCGQKAVIQAEKFVRK